MKVEICPENLLPVQLLSMPDWSKKGNKFQKELVTFGMEEKKEK